jgi:hypothetical protein
VNHTEFIRTHERLLSVVCSVVVGKMLSGWLVATRHLPRNVRMRVYRIPSRDFLLVCGQYLAHTQESGELRSTSAKRSVPTVTALVPCGRSWNPVPRRYSRTGSQQIHRSLIETVQVTYCSKLTANARQHNTDMYVITLCLRLLFFPSFFPFFVFTYLPFKSSQY